MEIKISKKPVKYEEAIEYLDDRVHQVSQNRNEELIWFKNNYRKIASFNYQNYIKKFGGAFEYFYSLGNHSNYFLYKKM